MVRILVPSYIYGFVFANILQASRFLTSLPTPQYKSELSYYGQYNKCSQRHSTRHGRTCIGLRPSLIFRRYKSTRIGVGQMKEFGSGHIVHARIPRTSI